MKNLDDMKKEWLSSQDVLADKEGYDRMMLEKIFKSRVKKHTKSAFQYFWAVFALQILVYALLTHVIIKHWSNTTTLLLSVAGILLFLPFTIVLMKKFKRMAVTIPGHSNDLGSSLQQYAHERYSLLLSFYHFKKRYELILVPLSALIGILISFELYVPGGITNHPVTAIVAFCITIFSCVLAIRSENKKSFEEPLRQLKQLIADFKNES